MTIKDIRAGTGTLEPLRIYSEDDARMPRRLATVLQESIDRLSTMILNGQLSAEDYRFYTGQLMGLRTALDECKRISEELS